MTTLSGLLNVLTTSKQPFGENEAGALALSCDFFDSDEQLLLEHMLRGGLSAIGAALELAGRKLPGWNLKMLKQHSDFWAAEFLNWNTGATVRTVVSTGLGSSGALAIGVAVVNALLKLEKV